MSDSEIFDRLVKELDPLERKELLDKLAPNKVIVSEPMLEKESEKEFDLEKEYYSLGLIKRIIIFFKVTFNGEDKFQLTEDIILKRIEREIRKNSGDIISYDKGILKQKFLDELEKLHYSTYFFKDTVTSACGSSRDEFLNFLGSLQIPLIHHQLILDTDYDRIERSTGYTNPSNVRKEVMVNVESNLGKITGDLRKTMYMNSKIVYVMGELVKYDFKGLEDLFVKDEKSEGKRCYFGDARARLEKLTDLLSAFHLSPDKQLLEAFFLYHNKYLKVGDQQEIGAKLKNYLDSAGKHIAAIKDFNNNIQLLKIMKLVSGNIDYKPMRSSGGEDWFNLYNKYWHSLAEEKYKKYSAEKRKQKIYKDMQMYFKKDEIPELEYYHYKYKYSCGFLSSFLRDQFTTSMNDILKTILVDGRFYKKSNKEDFTDSYTALLSLYQKLKNFDDKNTSAGLYGLKIMEIENELSSDTVREKKIAAIIDDSDMEGLDIVKTGLNSLFVMKNVIYGILFGKAGGQYDSLSNLNKLVTIESRDFIIDLNTVYSNIDDAYRILNDILSLEETA